MVNINIEDKSKLFKQLQVNAATKKNVFTVGGDFDHTYTILKKSSLRCRALYKMIIALRFKRKVGRENTHKEEK